MILYLFVSLKNIVLMQYIAFEYQGPQHYEEVPYMGVGKKELKEIQKRDKLKIKLCNKKGIKLFIISCYIPKNKLKSHIKEILTNYVNSKEYQKSTKK